MRKIIASINITLDGFIAGTSDELDWHFKYWNDEMAKFASEQLSNADTILLGRITYNAMAKFWPRKATDPSYPREDIAFAEMMNSHQKVVFSKTLQTASWNNSTLIGSNMGREVMNLKAQSGKNIMIYGSESIVSRLHRLGLIDEITLWIHPVFLKKGKALFKNGVEKPEFRLIGSKFFSSGVVILNYASTNASIHQFHPSKVHQRHDLST